MTIEDAKNLTTATRVTLQEQILLIEDNNPLKEQLQQEIEAIGYILNEVKKFGKIEELFSGIGNELNNLDTGNDFLTARLKIELTAKQELAKDVSDIMNSEYTEELEPEEEIEQ